MKTFLKLVLSLITVTAVSSCSSVHVPTKEVRTQPKWSIQSIKEAAGGSTFAKHVAQLAGLPAGSEGVVSQLVITDGPAKGGYETTFKYKGREVTTQLYKEGEVPVVRVFESIKIKGDEHMLVLVDNRADGFLDAYSSTDLSLLQDSSASFEKNVSLDIGWHARFDQIKEVVTDFLSHKNTI